jgi:cytochrome c-type biogenesis protein CcmH
MRIVARGRAALITAAVALTLGASGLAAQTTTRSDAELERLTRDVASQLRCPVCQGESIQDSPASLAQEMRAVVRTQLAAGRSPDEVKAYFVGRYGEWILLEPRASGFTLLVYILPLAALLGGIALVVFVVRRWTRGDAPVLAEDGPITPDD